jgi:hypothetical protein
MRASLLDNIILQALPVAMTVSALVLKLCPQRSLVSQVGVKIIGDNALSCC